MREFRLIQWGAAICTFFISFSLLALQPLFKSFESPAPVSGSFSTLPMVTFHAINTNEVLKTRLYDDSGDIPASILKKFNRFLRDHITKRSRGMDPRVIKLMYKCAVHFNAKKVVMISGYRVGNFGYHTKGKAIDFRIPGVKTQTLAAFARTLGKVGVGYYPNVDYIHLDSRSISYFWANISGKYSYGPDRELKAKWSYQNDLAWTPRRDLPFTRIPKKLIKSSIQL